MIKPPLLGLTLRRPWPLLIAKGIKRIENRPWHPEPRLQPGEWFAIHAGKKTDLRCQPMALRNGVSIDIFFGHPPANTESAIVAVAKYGGYTRASEDGWFFGPIGWILDDVVEVDPVPCKGAQQLWRVPDDVADRVRAGFKRAREARAA